MAGTGIEHVAQKAALDRLPGVAVTGLFVGRTDVLVVASPGGVEIRRPKGGP